MEIPIVDIDFGKIIYNGKEVDIEEEKTIRQIVAEKLPEAEGKQVMVTRKIMDKSLGNLRQIFLNVQKHCSSPIELLSKDGTLELRWESDSELSITRNGSFPILIERGEVAVLLSGLKTMTKLDEMTFFPFSKNRATIISNDWDSLTIHI